MHKSREHMHMLCITPMYIGVVDRLATKHTLCDTCEPCQRIQSILKSVFFADSDGSTGLWDAQMPTSPKLAFYCWQQTYMYMYKLITISLAHERWVIMLETHSHGVLLASSPNNIQCYILKSKRAWQTKITCELRRTGQTLFASGYIYMHTKCSRHQGHSNVDMALAFTCALHVCTRRVQEQAPQQNFGFSDLLIASLVHSGGKSDTGNWNLHGKFYQAAGSAHFQIIELPKHLRKGSQGRLPWYLARSYGPVHSASSHYLCDHAMPLGHYILCCCSLSQTQYFLSIDKLSEVKMVRSNLKKLVNL